MRIAVDAMGGDHAPAEIVKGAAQAAEEYGVDISLVGLPHVVHPLLDSHPRLQRFARACARKGAPMGGPLPATQGR